MHCVLIANPTAGRRRPDADPHGLASSLRAHDLTVDTCITARRGDAEGAARLAARRGCSLIAVAGGDGTVNEVVNGMLGSDVPLCILPCGTANVLAIELGLPFALEAACALASRGSPRAVDVGVANGRAFLLAAGIGYDAALVRSVSPTLKRRIGKAAYWWAGLLQFARAGPAAFRLDIDGAPAPRPYCLAVAANTAHYAGHYRLSPDGRPDDGLLDLYLAPAGGRASLLRALLAFVTGRASCSGSITTVRAQTLRCDEPGQPIHLDGDDFADTPLSIEVRPSALRILVGNDAVPGRDAAAAARSDALEHKP